MSHHAGPHSPKATHWAWCTIKAHKASCHQPCKCPGQWQPTQHSYRIVRALSTQQQGTAVATVVPTPGTQLPRQGHQAKMFSTQGARTAETWELQHPVRKLRNMPSKNDTRCAHIHMQLLDCGKPPAACLNPGAAASTTCKAHVHPGSTIESNATNPSKRSQSRRPPTSTTTANAIV
jgi:hypothetical protein